MALSSVRVVLGHSDETNDFASVMTVRIVLDFPRYGPKLLPMRLPSSKLEHLLVSVMLFDAIDCSAVESAIDMGEGSFIWRRGKQWRTGRRGYRRHFVVVAGRRPSGRLTPSVGTSSEYRRCIAGEVGSGM